MINKHPIQLKDIFVSNLSIRVNDDLAARKYKGELDVDFKVGVSDLSPEDPYVAVGMLVTCAPTKESGEQEQAGAKEADFEIVVELNGQFEVNFENFKFEHLADWARQNAPFLIFPYVREHVYGLALRAGLNGIILPLLIQPRALPKA